MKNESEALIEQSWMCMLFRHKRHMLSYSFFFCYHPVFVVCGVVLMCSLQPCVFGLASSAMFVPGFVFSPLSWNVHLSRWLLAGNWVQSRCLVRQAHFFPTAPARWRCARVIPFTVVIGVYNCQCQLILAGLWHSRKDVKPNHLQSRKLPKMSLAAKSRWTTSHFFLRCNNSHAALAG